MIYSAMIYSALINSPKVSTATRQMNVKGLHASAWAYVRPRKM